MFKQENVDELIDQVVDVVAAWDRYAQEVEVFPLRQKEIGKNLRLKLKFTNLLSDFPSSFLGPKI